MSDLFHNLVLGFGVAVSPINLLLCLIGALVGTLVGVLPGIGTIATVAMLLPITFGLPPVGALIMLAGAISASAGILIERWLFFADATHTVALYYRGGANAAT